MRVIGTIRGHVIEPFDGPTETITPQLLDSILEPVYQNKLRIFDTTFNIEDTLERIISYYFFGDDERNKERAQRFSALVLASDWCSFSSKRRLVMHIVNETGALKGEAKNEYEKLLMKVMSIRNAFAHGTVSTDGRRVKLAYYEGTPRTKFLDDDYLTDVETALNRCWQITHGIGFATGALKRHEP